MKHFSLTIEALSPLALNASKGETVLTQSMNFIPAAMLRGVLAARYIEENDLGAEAHKKQGFVDAFFKKLHFLAGMPMCDNGHAFEAPMSLRKSKDVAGAEPELVDLLHCDADDVKAGLKRVKGLVVLSNKTVSPIRLDKKISMHMSRSSEEERIAGKSIDGGIFNYEALSAGQLFQGGVCGDEETLVKLLEALKVVPGKTIECYIGRSKYSQYGHCRITFGEISELPIPKFVLADTEDGICIRLNSPVIPYTNMLLNGKDCLQELIEASLGEEFYIQQAFCSVENIDSFVGVWGLRRPRARALAAGSVFKLAKKNGIQWTEADIKAVNELLDQGIGTRREEGYGQLRSWKAKDLSFGKSAPCKLGGQITEFMPNGPAAQLARSIVKKYILNIIRQIAFEQAQAIPQKQLSGKTHFFSRLTSLLGSRNDIMSKHHSFRDNVVNAMSRNSDTGTAGTPFNAALKGIIIKDNRLVNWLTENGQVPYIDELLQDRVEDKQLTKLMDELNMRVDFDKKALSKGEFYYEYWYWLCRYCRKRAANQGKAGDING